MKSLHSPSVFLAALLQLAPLGRALSPAVTSLAGPAAILLRWVAGTTAVLGAFHTVSGASTAISSAATSSGTVGKSFIYRITTSGDPANAWKWEPATAADSLPPGLSLITVKPTPGVIRGTPTAGGVYHTRIWASDNWKASRTVSKLVTFTIVDPTVAPTITAPPSSQSVIEGGTVSFTVAADGTAPFTYQWLYNNAPLANQSSASLTLQAVAVNQAGSYAVKVSNSAGSATSTPASLTVKPAANPPAIVTAPQPLTVTEGETASFSVTATGTAPFTYEWLFDGNPIPGETSSTLSLPNVAQSQAGNYRVRVTNSAGNALSDAAQLVVNQRPPPPAPKLSIPTLVGGEIDMTFYGVAGVQYVIEYADDPVPGYWRVLQNLPVESTARLIHVSDVPTSAHRWYRVRAQ